MSVALECTQCGRAIHSSALSGVCTACLVNTTRSGLATGVFSPGEALWSGRTVGPQDRFMLLKKIGQGGMGEIWLANDEHLSNGREARPVALKFLSEEIRTNPKAMMLLREEVARTQTLNHPNIVRIHDMHATMDGTPFIKMEYVEGDSLAHWLRASGEPMPWRMACELGQQVALALDYAHRSASLVHRDVKPANVLVGKGPCAKLTDFGIAQALHQVEEPSESEPTGTIGYMSPEQLTGKAPSPADDVYALGATLFELLTGSTPSEAGTAEAQRAHTIYTVPENVNARLQRLGRPERIPSDLAGLVAQCLQKHGSDRPTMKRVAALLGQLTGLTEEAAPKPERLAWLQPAALAVLLIAGVFAARRFDLIQKIQARIRPIPPATENPVRRESESPPAEEPGSPPERAPNAGVSAADPMERPAPAGSIAVVTISEKGGQRTTVRIYRGSEQVHEDLYLSHARLGQPRLTLYTSSIAGPHRVVVSQQEYGADAEREVRLEPGATNRADVYLGGKEVYLVSDPNESDVSWKSADSPWTKYVARGGSRNFKTETPYTFVFQKDGYRRLEIERVFSNQAPETLSVKLERVVAPRFGAGAPPEWTNGLGMVFRLIGDLRVCTTETTVGQYRRFVEATGFGDSANGMFSMTKDGRRQAGFSWSNPGFEQSPDHPVVGVSEIDARKFCQWLTGAKEEGLLDGGQTYRLPTTEEWIAFSGAGDYPWGNSGDSAIGNFSGREVAVGRGHLEWPISFPLLGVHEDPWIRTAPVTARAAISRTGLSFIAGNVAERCEGGFICGGSWFDGENLPPYDRYQSVMTMELLQTAAPNERDDRWGFRVVIAEKRGSR